MKHVYSKDGTPIALDRSGEGPAIILVGGALSDRAAGVSLAEQLASHFTVFTYDRRGRGDSGDTPPYAPLREVEDIAAIIDEAGGKAFLFGHSSGAVLALDAAAQGLAIPQLALYEPPFIVDDSRPPLPADYVSHLNQLIAAGRRYAPRRASARRYPAPSAAPQAGRPGSRPSPRGPCSGVGW
jgi:pimeloyl-ACP methyl ester carboxylesterase